MQIVQVDFFAAKAVDEYDGDGQWETETVDD